MKKDGKADVTLKGIRKSLERLSKLCNLADPESVKVFIATFDRKNGYKKQLCYAYDCYVKANGLTWRRPKYIASEKMPRIPQKAHINYHCRFF